MHVARCLAALLLCVAAAAALAGSAQDKAPANKGIAGIWQGTLKLGAVELRVVIKVPEKKTGKMAGTLDSPDQGAKDIPVDTVELTDGKVKVVVKAVNATFEGKANKDLTEIVGEWKQGPGKLPLTLKRVAKAVVVNRPQHPKKPYPYREEEVKFKNEKAGIEFTGTLTLPRGDGPFPAVFLITGSGPQDRDETIFAHKPFLVLADHLTRHGIAVLRADDRGVGGSGGDTMKSTTADFAGDALAAVAFLKGRKEINSKQIGLIGHSEGGIVAPLAATRSPDVAFIVLLAGTGLNGEEILYLQGQAVLKSMGASEKMLARQRSSQEMIFKIVKEEKDNDKAKERIVKAAKEILAKLLPEEKKEVEKFEQPGQLDMVVTPWFRYFLTYDPRPVLRKVRVPVLAVCGEKDVQVPPKENLKAIHEALEAGGNKDHTEKELKGLNHLFQTCKTGAVTEYGQIEETFAPAALKEVSDWIVKRTKKE
jgi:pimeloyl-ACP methyl ester carboxylesterase